LKLQSRRDDEKFARERFLGGMDLYLNKFKISWILNHIDCFVSQSRGNESVEVVYLWLYAFDGHDDDIWDNVGEAIGNLQALEMHFKSRLLSPP
jgi:hypothetical protein